MMKLRKFLALALVACGGASQNGSEAVSLPQQPPGASASSQVALAQPVGREERDTPIPITNADAVWGNRHALVTIVEFSDFQCPYCARGVDTVNQLEKEYGPEKLRVVFKHAPLSFHPNARPAAEAAQAVRMLGGNRAFWTFYDLAFHDQGNLGDASYETWAQQSGVSVSALRDALQSKRFSAKIDDDIELGRTIGVNGTPAFFINGVSLGGAQPADKFRAIIDPQLAAANDKLAKGTPADDLYAVLSKANFKKAVDDDDEDTTTVWKLPLGTSPQLGTKTALVTIVAFSDFQCPYCKKVQPTLQQIKSTYGNDVRFVFKQEPLPFHPRAEPAAELALEARAENGDAGFWAAHDKLFASQPQLDDADLEKVATDLKLDVAKVKTAIATHKYKSTIETDQSTADDFQASGTPHFFIDGRRLVGAQPFDKFKTIIDEELAKAKALVAAGTKPENVYEELTKNGKSPPPPEQKTVTFTTAAPVKGPASAQVTIVELSDFQDPYTKRAQDTLDEIMKAYPTKVKLVWRHNPLPYHQHAELAAEAAIEAYKQKGNDGFWKLHTQLFAHQADQDGLERASIEGYAKTLGLDMGKLKTALDTASHANDVDADAKAAKGVGISGTPTFLIGTGNATGRPWTAYVLIGAVPISKFRKLIDLALGSHP
ncbi:MAG TPA: thioredoxin domain-containing protein [Polyangiaceae bacterium]|nr:thioredoxin domain-containing protein [Polyangiaceae bacterium]